MSGRGWRLTQRGRVVAWLVGLLVAWLTFRYLQAGYDDCLARGFSRVVCGG